MSFLSAIQRCASAAFRDVTTITVPGQPPCGFKDADFPQAIHLIHQGESDPRIIAFVSPRVFAASDAAKRVELFVFRYDDVLIINSNTECAALIAIKLWDVKFLQATLKWTFEFIAYHHHTTTKLVKIFSTEELSTFLSPILSTVKTFRYSLHALTRRRWVWPWPGMNVQREHALLLLVTLLLGSNRINPHVPKAYEIWSRNKAVKTNPCNQLSQCLGDCLNCANVLAFHLQRMGGCPEHFVGQALPPQPESASPIAKVFADKLRMFLSPRETEEDEWELMTALLQSTAKEYPDGAQFLPPDLFQYIDDDTSPTPELHPDVKSRPNSKVLIWPFRDEDQWGVVVAISPSPPHGKFRLLASGALHPDDKPWNGKKKRANYVPPCERVLENAAVTLKHFLARYSKHWKHVPQNLHWEAGYWTLGENPDLEILRAEYALRHRLLIGALPGEWEIPSGETLLFEAAWRMAKQDYDTRAIEDDKTNQGKENTNSFTIPVAFQAALLDWELSCIVSNATGIATPSSLKPAHFHPAVWEVLAPCINLLCRPKQAAVVLRKRVLEDIVTCSEEYRGGLSFIPEKVIDFLVHSFTNAWLAFGNVEGASPANVTLTMAQIPLAGDGSCTPFIDLSDEKDGSKTSLVLGVASHLEHACAPTNAMGDWRIDSSREDGLRIKSLSWSTHTPKPTIYQAHRHGAYNNNCVCKRCLDAESIRDSHHHMLELSRRSGGSPLLSAIVRALPSTGVNKFTPRSTDTSNTLVEHRQKRPLNAANMSSAGAAPVQRPGLGKRARVTPPPGTSSPASLVASIPHPRDGPGTGPEREQHPSTRSPVATTLASSTSSPVSRSTHLRQQHPSGHRIIDPAARNRLSAAPRASPSNNEYEIMMLNAENDSLRAQLAAKVKELASKDEDLAAARSEIQYLRDWLHRVWMRETNLLKRFGIFAAQALGNSANLYNRYMRRAERDRAWAKRFYFNGGPTGSGCPIEFDNEAADNSDANTSDDEDMAAQLAKGVGQKERVEGEGHEEQRWEREDREAAERGKGKGRGSGNRRESGRRK